MINLKDFQIDQSESSSEKTIHKFEFLRREAKNAKRAPFRIVSPRQTTKADVLYVPGVNLQLITQERDHKDAHNRACPVLEFFAHRRQKYRFSIIRNLVAQSARSHHGGLLWADAPQNSCGMSSMSVHIGTASSWGRVDTSVTSYWLLR